MEQKDKIKDKTIKVTVSRDHNLRIEQLLEMAKSKEPNSRLTKQKVIECAIDKMVDSDLVALARKNIDRKALILKYLKEDKKIENPKALIKLIEDEVQL